MRRLLPENALTCQKKHMFITKNSFRFPYVVLTLCLISLEPMRAMAGSEVQWNSPYVGDTLGGQLENEYSKILKECNINSLEYEKKSWFSSDIRMSSIPGILQTHLNLTQKVWAQNNESIARLFSFVYPSSDITDFQFDQKWLAFKGNYTADPSRMLPEGRSSTIYIHNCTSIVSAASTASMSYNLPVISIKSALNAEYSGSQKTSVALISGKFISPYGQLNGSANDSLFGLISLWDWYVNNPEAINANLYRITSFDGVALFEILEKKRNESGAVKLSGNASLFASIDSTIQSIFTDESRTEVKQYTTYANKDDNGVPEITFEKIPTPSAISNAVGKYSLDLIDGYVQLLQTGIPSVHKQKIAGIPGALCNTSYWKVVPEKQTDNIRLISAMLSQEPKIPGFQECEIAVEFTPDSTAIGNVGQYLLKYSLVSNNDIKQIPLKIMARPVPFITTRSPVLQERGYKNSYELSDLGNGDSRMNWSVDVSVIDGDNIIDWDTPADLNDIKISCAKREITAIDSEKMQLTHSDRKGNISISYYANSSYNLDVHQTNTKPELCRLSGNVRFARRNGGSRSFIDRTLPLSINILFPQTMPVAQTQQESDKSATSNMPVHDSGPAKNVKGTIESPPV